MKLIRQESESGALLEWLGERTDVGKCTSALSIVEVIRACRRIDDRLALEGRRTLSNLDLIPIGSHIVEDAAMVGQPDLRGLDAIHLSSALSVRSAVSTFVTYDERLKRAAEAEGLVVSAPH
jgi:predicted nucleic acid-binding protein